MVKGVSGAEKRRRLEQLFHETKEFYQLKDLEKIASKQKGIVSNTVKDVLTELCDDNLVQKEKIGSSWYFWSFPSSIDAARTNKIAQLQEEVAQLESKNAELSRSINEKELDGRQISEERKRALEELGQLETDNAALLKSLNEQAETDPSVWEAKKVSIALACDNANKWTDNIFLLQQYCTNNLGVDKNDFKAQFGIDDDFDNV